MENLGIDQKLIIAQLINFALFFYIFKRFIAKPFIRFIDSEKNKDVERERALKGAKEQEEEVDKKLERVKQDIKKESAQIIAEAKDAAEKIKSQILDEANEQAEIIRAKTKKQLLEEKEEILRQARDKVLDLSFYLVNSTLKDALTDDVRKKVTARIVKNLPSKITFDEN